MHGENGDYVTWLRSLLREAERAMEAEGVDAGVRQRVVNRVLFGEPEPEPEPATVTPPMNAGGL